MTGTGPGTGPHEAALRAIDRSTDALVGLSRAIHGDPEIAYEEHRARRRLTDVLAQHGFGVQEDYGGLPTAFRADAGGAGDGPVVAFLAEYDALPEIGHGCGHNLIAMMAVAAALGVRAVLETLPGTICVIGTPAEEGGGGKIVMLRAGAFADVDAAMLVHPANRTLAYRGSLASDIVDVEFTGRAAHAAKHPERGVNALDAMIQTFNNIGMMRQYLGPRTRVHGIITNGGSAANVVPDFTSAIFRVRGADRGSQREAMRRLVACVEGAAQATGAQHVIRTRENCSYESMVASMPMADRWARHAEDCGLHVDVPAHDEPMGSTDTGNLSHVVPCIHPYVTIVPRDVPGHSVAFRDAAGGDEAHAEALAAAKAMALTAIDLLTDSTLRDAVVSEFEQRRSGPTAG